MNRINNSQVSKNNRIAIIALIVAGVIFIAIAAYAITKKSSESSGSRTPEHTQSYIGLDNVIIPKNTPSEIKEYEGFKLSFNKNTRVPNWVSWELLRHETDGEQSRSNNVWEDTDIEGCATLNDYRRSGYDRGHMCPAADQKWSEKAMSDCFVLSNMAPQDHALTPGAWNGFPENVHSPIG